MIFVVVGLIILVASFLLALHSLIREQNQSKTFTEEKTDFEKSHLKKSEIDEKRKLPPARKQDYNPLDDEVPFYWLKNMSNRDIEDEVEEAKIEKIKQQLENIRVSRDIFQKSATINLEEQNNKKPSSARLSGGFTIEELKKQVIQD